MEIFTVNEIYVNERLDVFLTKMTTISRSQIKNLIEDKKILVNNKSVKAGYKLSFNDNISLIYPKEIKPYAENIDFKIIYEDKDIAIISKPQDLVVHIGSGNISGTLVNGLLNKFESLSDIDPNRPGIVHRLDKDTSGLMIIAKNNESHINLVEQFKNSEIKKSYLAIVHGKTKDYDIINAPIGRDEHNRKKMAVIYSNSKPAVSEYKKIKEFNEYSLLCVSILTGRTHQIRVHMAYVGHPVLGDLVYGRKNNLKIDKQMLHSYRIAFKHPRTGEFMNFQDDYPERFKNIIKRLK